MRVKEMQADGSFRVVDLMPSELHFQAMVRRYLGVYRSVYPSAPDDEVARVGAAYQEGALLVASILDEATKRVTSGDSTGEEMAAQLQRELAEAKLVFRARMMGRQEAKE